jgi:hypothetical protein
MWQRSASTISAHCAAVNSAPNLLRRVGASPTVAAACLRRGGRLAHQTCCDVSGRARPSRRRACAALAISSTPNLLRRVGASPTVAVARGGASAMSSAPNLLRRVGASPTVAAACARRGGRLAHQTCCDVLGRAQPSRRRVCAAWGRLAHQTYCDVLGQARPSRRRVRAAWGRLAHQTYCDVLGRAQPSLGAYARGVRDV